MQISNSLSGCKNAGLQLLLRTQECRFQDAGMIVLSRGMGYSLICLRSPDPTE
jgi:hypothetical protein